MSSLPPAAPGDLRVAVHHHPTSITVAAEGELDLHTVPVLRAATDRLDGRQDVVLDLGGLSFIDSTGLHLLIDVRNRCRSNSTSLRVVASPVVTRALEVGGIATLFDRVGAAPR